MMGLSPSLPLRNSSVTASLFSSTSSPPSSSTQFTANLLYPHRKLGRTFSRPHTILYSWHDYSNTSWHCRAWSLPFGSPPPLLNSLWPAIHPHYSVGAYLVKILVNTMGVSTMISQPQVCLTMAPMRLFWTAIHSGFPREGEKTPWLLLRFDSTAHGACLGMT